MSTPPTDAGPSLLPDGESAPVRAQPLGYDEDRDDAGSWVPLVKTIGLVALIAGVAGVAQVVMLGLSLAGVPGVLPLAPARTSPAQLVFALPPVLLVAGGVACLRVHPWGRRFMLGYVVLTGGKVLLQLGVTASMFWRERANFGGAGGSVWGSGAWVFYHSLSIPGDVAFPVLVWAVMLQPPVRRLFSGR